MEGLALRYSVDTNSLTRAWWDRYPPDLFPGFWEELRGLIESGEMRATDEVRVELEKQDDDLVKWCQAVDGFFVDIDDEIQESVADILRDHARLFDNRKNRSGADPWVIALAQVHSCIVVTEEQPTNSTRRPHIPDVCQALGIQCFGILGVIRQEGWVFR